MGIKAEPDLQDLLEIQDLREIQVLDSRGVRARQGPWVRMGPWGLKELVVPQDHPENQDLQDRPDLQGPKVNQVLMEVLVQSGLRDNVFQDLQELREYRESWEM